MNRRRNYVLTVMVVILMVAVVGVMGWGIANREWVVDYVRGMNYEPFGEMARIRDDLKLTERGEFLFNATRPELDGEETFNANCRKEMDVEVAILGCYTGDSIYVYNVDSDELEGIRELTTAHELLHAVWARMDESEKTELKGALEQVYNENKDVLEKELATYDTSERDEELYVRVGTEIAELPIGLEEHYAKIFTNQDLIVGFYDSYITVFREIEAEMDVLKNEMEVIKTQLDEKTAEYERRFGQLNADVVSFNTCAEVAGCFASEGEFYSRREVLMQEQNALDAMYEELNNLVNAYNERVEKYNADVTRSEKLNWEINSNRKPEVNL